MIKPRFFKTAGPFRAWLEVHHERASELLVGFHRKNSEKASMTWPESVDEALCFGWIDGIRHSLDATSYTVRFTPRKPKSIWSNVNIAKVQEQIRLGRMTPAGLAAFARRDVARSGVYSFERMHACFDAEAEQRFKHDGFAWAFFNAQPPGYRRLAMHWVTSAKRPETRARRLAELIEGSSKRVKIRWV